MRTLMLTLALAAAGAGCKQEAGGPAKAGEHADDVPTMSMDDVEKALTAKQIVAIDCNGDTLRKKEGVLPGAILVEDEETFPASVLPADKTAKLLFYCSGPG